jgi:hypothetical protein
MNAIARYVVHVAQAKTGLNTAVLADYIAQGVLALITAVLFLVAIFFVFANYFGFGATKTSIGMFLFFAAVLLGAVIWTSHTKKQIKQEAQRALSRPRKLFAINPPC